MLSDFPVVPSTVLHTCVSFIRVRKPLGEQLAGRLERRGGVSRAPPRWLKLGALLVAEGAGAGFRGSRGAGGAGVLPSRPLSRQRRFSWFLLQMLLLGVVGAAVGRVAGSGGDSLGFRGLLFLVFLLSSLFPVWPWLTLKTL